jgi:hypothetical protein
MISASDSLEGIGVALQSHAAVRLLQDEWEIVIDGPHYLDVLPEIHRRLQPRTYFEIGTWQGASLSVAQCASLAVDSDFQLNAGVLGSKPLCIFHQTTSDAFFASHEARDVLGAPVDLAFIDAFHVFENVLREFIGTERSCHPSSVILIDDACPRDLFMTRRQLSPERPEPTKYPGYWTGDVWKIAPIIREFRPDIHVELLDTQPTGLLVCSGLNPNDSTLASKYDEIVSRWQHVTLEQYGMDTMLDDLGPRASGSWLSEARRLYPEDPELEPELASNDRSMETVILTLSEELRAVYESRSWRLTQPLRDVGAILRKVRRGQT